MTTIKNQVTCSLCIMKIGELQWMDNLVSTNQLELCKNDGDEIAIKFFTMIFDTIFNKSEIYKMKNGKTQDFWQSYFATKLPKEKLNIFCSDSNNYSE